MPLCCSLIFSKFFTSSPDASAQRRRFMSQGGVFTGLLAAQSMMPGLAQQAPAAELPGGMADLIYFGGDIVTVDERQPDAQAVAVRR